MSLHWILMLTVTLLHCLTAHPINNEIETIIEELKKVNCSEPDSTFYSPSGTNGCTIKALDCSFQELDKVLTECFEQNSRNFKIVKRVKDRIIKRLKQDNITLPANFESCFCGQEKLAEKPYEEFLDNILTLVQMLNSS